MYFIEWNSTDYSLSDLQYTYKKKKIVYFNSVRKSNVIQPLHVKLVKSIQCTNYWKCELLWKTACHVGPFMLDQHPSGIGRLVISSEKELADAAVLRNLIVHTWR